MGVRTPQLGGMLVHRRVTLPASINLPLAIYTLGRGEALQEYTCTCSRTQHNDHLKPGLWHGLLNPESSKLTMTSPLSPVFDIQSTLIIADTFGLSFCVRNGEKPLLYGDLNFVCNSVSVIVGCLQGESWLYKIKKVIMHKLMCITYLHKLCKLNYRKDSCISRTRV